MSFFGAFKEELKLYLYDKWLLASVSVVPLVLFTISLYIFGNGAIRNVPIGVIDYDKSSMSRGLLRYFDASSTLHVKGHFLNQKDGIEAMRGGDIYALIIIPLDFEKDVKKSLTPTVGAYFNAQFILIGRSIKSALNSIMTNYNAKISIGKNLLSGDTKLSQAFSEAVPLQQQITPIYNISLNYTQFLLSIILPCIWQIIMVSTMVLSISVQKRKTTIEKWLADGGFKAFFMKLFVHGLFMLFLCLCFLFYFYIYLGWQMNGSLFEVILAGVLTILASQAMGSMFYFVTYDAPRALSGAAAYTAPSLAFVGVTFPFSDMAPFAQVWHKLLPISHYLNIQISQANYGIGSVKDIYYLLGFNLAFIVVVLSIRLVALRRVR